MLEREIRLMSYVPRWCIVQVNNRRALSDHSFHVGIVALRIVKDLELVVLMGSDIDLGEILEGCLTHDITELQSGDIPGPAQAIAKQAPGWRQWILDKTLEFFPWFSEDHVKPMTKVIVEIADRLEAILYLREESGMGNQYVGGHIDEMSNRLLTETLPLFKCPQGIDPYTFSVFITRVKFWVDETLRDFDRSPRVLGR